MGLFSLHSIISASFICVSLCKIYQVIPMFQTNEMTFEKSKRARMLKIHHHAPQDLRGHRWLKAKCRKVRPK